MALARFAPFLAGSAHSRTCRPEHSATGVVPSAADSGADRDGTD